MKPSSPEGADGMTEGQTAEVIDGEFCIGRIKACPLCTTPLGVWSCIQEYWIAATQIVDIWCATCHGHVTLDMAPDSSLMEPAGSPHDHL